MLKTIALMLCLVSASQAHDLALKPKTMRVRVTVYWKSGSGTDWWTRRGESATGEPLVDKASCAVDPKKIPYGSVVHVPGYGMAKAVDTGSAVVRRCASGGKLNVVDLYFDKKSEALAWSKTHPLELNVVITNPAVELALD